MNGFGPCRVDLLYYASKRTTLQLQNGLEKYCTVDGTTLKKWAGKEKTVFEFMVLQYSN